MSQLLSNSDELPSTLPISPEALTLPIATTPESAPNSNNIDLSQQTISYAEMLVLYEKEKTLRIDMETTFQQKAKESSKQIENLNREMTNLASIIDDLHKQYVNLQNQYQFQVDSLIKLNEDIRNELHLNEIRLKQFESENLKLKAENKQFYGELTILTKELDEQYQMPTGMEEAIRQINILKSDKIKLILANQAFNKKLAVSDENVKHLQKVNLDYQRSNNMQDQMVITQSLESELERERKVRLEIEGEKQDAVSQLKMVKEKGQAIVESLKVRLFLR
jgi:hypothetical protein